MNTYMIIYDNKVYTYFSKIDLLKRLKEISGYFKELTNTSILFYSNKTQQEILDELDSKIVKNTLFLLMKVDFIKGEINANEFIKKGD